MVPFLAKQQCAIAGIVVFLIMLVGFLPPPSPALAQAAVMPNPAESLPGIKKTALAGDTITGDWELTYESYWVLGSDGNPHEIAEPGTILIRLESEFEDELFTGEYLAVRGSTCLTNGGIFEGLHHDDGINWVMAIRDIH